MTKKEQLKFIEDNYPLYNSIGYLLHLKAK